MSTPNFRTILPGLLLAIMLSALDSLIVGTALPRIVDDLGGVAFLSWVVGAYVLGTSVSTPIWGKLGDLFGRRKTFLTSIVIFLVGSVLCGMAQDMPQLIGFRGLQGLGAGGLLVGSMAIIGDLVPPRERGKYQGLVAGVMSIAMIAGPVIGGLITDHLSWRWAFYVNVPVGGVAFVLLLAKLRLPHTERVSRRIDWLGAVLVSIGITAIVLLTSIAGTRYPWGSVQVIGLVVVTVVVLTVFVLVERRAVEPIVPLELFRSRNFALMSGIGFMLGFSLFGAVNFLPLYQQLVQGLSATSSGLLFLPMLFGTLVTSVVVGRQMTSTGRYKIYPVTGGVVMLVGTVLLALLGPDTPALVASLYMLVLGVGTGFLMQTTVVISQNSVDPKDLGAATSASTLIRSIGGLFGVSLAGAIFSNRIVDQLTVAVGAQEAEKLAGAAGNSTVGPESIASLPAAVQRFVVEAFASGTATVFLWAAVGVVAVPVLALLVKEVPLRGANGAPGDQRPETAAGQASAK